MSYSLVLACRRSQRHVDEDAKKPRAKCLCSTGSPVAYIPGIEIFCNGLTANKARAAGPIF